MDYSAYEELNSLEVISFIAGSPYTLEFQVKDRDGNPVHLTGKTVKWVLCKQGDPTYAFVNKAGNILATDDTKFSIVLVNADTKDLDEGIYIQQPIIIDYDSQEFRPTQGEIYIAARING